MHKVVLLGACVVALLSVITTAIVRFDRVSKPDADWANIRRQTQNALATAESEAISVGRRELDSWHASIMAKVDKVFLDQHLSLSNKWSSTARYLWRWTLSDADAAVTEQLERQNKLFRDTVLSDAQHLTDMQLIADKMADAFTDALDKNLAGIAQEHQLNDAEIDSGLMRASFLARINILAGRDDAERIGRRFMLTKRAAKIALRITASMLSTFGKITRVELLHGEAATEAAKESARHMGKETAKHAAKEAAHHVAKAAAHKAAVAGAKASAVKAGTATAGKVSGIIVSGPFALVVISGVVAWEWWGHSMSIAEKKPVLLNEIGQTFSVYESQLLKPDGHLGSIIRQLRIEIDGAISH